MNRYFSSLLFCVGLMLGVAPVTFVASPANAQSKYDAELESRLASAIEDYDILEIQAAQRKLEDAIALAERNDVETGQALARVYVMLAIVEFAGSRDEGQAEKTFIKAVEAYPKIEIDPVYKTPTLSDLMERARRRAKPKTPKDNTPKETPKNISGLTHEAIATADAGKNLDIEAFVPADQPVFKVFLHFRRFDQTDYTRVEMAPTSNTRFAITLEGSEVTSSQIEYFILAENRGGEIIDQVGTSDAPLTIVVLGSSDVAPPDDKKDDDKKDDDDVVDPDGTDRTWVYITLLGGTDIGFLPGGEPTANPEREVNPGFVPAFGHALVDLGVTITEAAHLGIYFRYQFAPAQDFTNIELPEESFPATKEECLGLGLPGDCMLGLKYKYFFKTDGVKLYSSAGGGVGRVRNWLQLPQDANTPQCEGKPVEFDAGYGEICYIRDTVRTGWMHFGVGGGLAYELTDFMDFTADTYLMLLVPETSVNVDVSAGFTFRF